MKNLGNYLIAAVIALVIAGLLGLVYYINQTQTVIDSGRTMAELVEESEAAVDREKTLIIGVDSAYPPMTFRDSASVLTGFDIELARAAVQIMGKDVIFKGIVWSEKTDDLNNNTIDLIWSGLNVTDERKEIYTLSQPYFKNRQVIVVKAASPIYGMEQLGGAVVGIQKGTFVGDQIKNFATANGEKIASVNEDYSEAATAMTALLKNEIDAVVMDETQARYFANSSPNTFRILSNADFGSNDIAVAARKGRTDLAQQVNAALDQLNSNGMRQKIVEKWFGSGN